MAGSGILQSGFGETTRILLVSTQESTFEEVSEILAEHLGNHQLYWVSQPELVLVRAADIIPHVVLIDEELLGMDIERLITQLLASVPETEILAIVGWDSMATASKAVLAGARAFVTKPISREDLIISIRRVIGSQRPSALADDEPTRSGSVVVFCAPKGGTGRTTTCINTALWMQEISNRQVAMVDADFAAPALDVALNLKWDRSIGDLLPRLAQVDNRMLEDVLATHASGLRVLLAPPPGELTDEVSLPQVQRITAMMKRMFPFVLVDLGLPMNDTAFAFLDSADHIVITVQPEMVGLRNTRRMVDRLIERGYSAERIDLVVIRSNIRGAMGREDIERSLKIPVEIEVPDDQPLVTHSINTGVPLQRSNDRGSVSKAYRKLAEHLLQELGFAASSGKDAARDDSRFSWFARKSDSSA